MNPAEMLTLFFIFAFGCCIGSFLNVVPIEKLGETSRKEISEIEILENGPLFTKLEITTSTQDIKFTRVATIYWNDGFIDFKIDINSDQEDKALVTQKIPLSAKNPQNRFGTSFGSVIHQEWKEDIEGHHR